MKKKPRTQSSMILYFTKYQNEETENEDNLISGLAPPQKNTQSPDDATKGLQ